MQIMRCVYGRVRTGLGLTLMVALLETGCSSSLVYSYPTADGVLAAKHQGFTYARYSLQRTMLTVSIDDATDGSGAATSSSDNKTDTTAKAAASVTVNATINLSAAKPSASAPGTPSASDKDQSDAQSLAATCAGLRKTYDQNRLQYLAYQASIVGLQAKVATWQSAAVSPPLKDVSAGLSAFVAARIKGGAGLKAAQVVAPFISDHCPATFKLSVTQKDEPDPDKSFYAVVSPNDFFDDQVSMQTAGDGTLVSVGYTSVDRTSDIAANLAKSVTTLALTASGIPMPPLPALGPSTCKLKIGPAKTDWPQSLKAVPTPDQFRALAACLHEEGDGLAALEDIDVAHFEEVVAANGRRDMPLPHTLQLHIVCSDKGKDATADPTTSQLVDQSQAGAQPEVGAQAAPGVAQVTATARQQQDGSAHAQVAVAANGVRDDVRGKGEPGILVSSPQTCLVVIGLPWTKLESADVAYGKELGIGGEKILSRTLVSALDSGAPIRLPLGRTSFVTRTSTYTFTAGRLTTATYNRPSPLVGAALLPAALVGAVAGTITGEIKSRTDRRTAQTGYVNAGNDYIAAGTKRKQAEKDAKAADISTTP